MAGPVRCGHCRLLNPCCLPLDAAAGKLLCCGGCTVSRLAPMRLAPWEPCQLAPHVPGALPCAADGPNSRNRVPVMLQESKVWSAERHDVAEHLPHKGVRAVRAGRRGAVESAPSSW